MAITRKYQAQAVVSPAQHSQLVTMAETLRKRQIEILSAAPNADGTVTVTFNGQGLGKWALPMPPRAHVAFSPGQIDITQA